MIAGAFSSASGKADVTLTSNGDILYYNSGRQRLPKEDNDDVLTLKSGLPSWEAAAGGGATTAIVESRNTSSQTSTDTSFVDLTDLSITKPDITDGKCHTTFEATIDDNTANEQVYICIEDNGAVVSVNGCITTSATLEFPLSISDDSLADGNTAVAQMKVSGGTGRVAFSTDQWVAKISSFGVG